MAIFREAMIKLGGVTLMLLGIGLFTIGLLLASKFMQATGFISGVVSLVLLYYTWATSNSRPIEEEPNEIGTVAK